MKKNGWVLLLFIVLGLFAGALIARWLLPLKGISFLTEPLTAKFSPDIDLYVLSFSFDLTLSISLLSIVGALLAIWLYRKM